MNRLPGVAAVEGVEGITPRKTRGFTTMPKAGELWLAEIPFTSGMASTWSQHAQLRFNL